MLVSDYNVTMLFVFFQQIVNQTYEDSDRCYKEEEKSDREVSEERYR